LHLDHESAESTRTGVHRFLPYTVVA
jgi:hypothetical protein